VEGRNKLGIWDQHIQTTIYKINKNLLYSTGNYIQCLLVAVNGKESEKEDRSHKKVNLLIGKPFLYSLGNRIYYTSDI